MNYSRRDWTFLLPALAAAAASGANKPPMSSLALPFETLPVKTNGENRARDVFDGYTHSGFHIDMHESELAPGLAPHPPHHHEHEEMVMVQQGTLEVTIAGKVTTVGPGSVVYVASNEEHGWHNAGTTRANYFVLALGRERK
jgi:quercetin dioxygenase-like cupin family protein